MIALVLALQLVVPEPPECRMWYYTRLTWETAPGEWRTGAIGPLKGTREEATVLRDEILRVGYTVPPFLEGWSDSLHIAPGAVKSAPVRRVCCYNEGPIEDWYCVYPDGE